MKIKDSKKFKIANNRHSSQANKWILFAVLVSGNLFLHQVLFSQNNTKITASASGNINCNNSSITLNCSPADKNITNIWKGPNGYISTAKNPVTSIPGEYTVNIINPSTGKTSSADVTVLLDTIAPKDISTTASGVLTCKDTLITLDASSATPGVTFEWFGPENFTSTEKNTVTSIPGIYIIKATNPVNGCISKKNVSVHQDTMPPENVTAFAGGLLTCVTSDTKLTGTSDTPEVSYHWQGPGGFTSSQSTPLISSPGIFELTVMKPDNGCIAKTSVEVKQDTMKPAGVHVTISDTLSCKTHRVQLNVLSVTKRVNYNWTGPDNFSSENPSVQSNIPGKYTVSVTNSENGCITTKHAEVIENVKPPEDLTLNVSGKLTCKDSIVLINTLSEISGLKYIWNGPKNYTSKSASPRISIPGEYNVEATNPVNGCSVTRSIDVEENIAKPSGVKAKVSGEIDCNNSSVKLKGECDDEKMNYTWEGPEGFKSSKQNTETTFQGDYTLTVINPENGCISTANIKVLNNCSE